MANALAQSLSPYLLQHQDNPVDWVPWSEEAFSTARQRDVPVFVSVGYAACHWCHVMAHESFENQQVGDYLNEHFVCIKVDREERPDIDQVYMNAVQLMTGHGGWPMSVFLDHDARPFYSGTYWPLHARGGMPGFPQVLEALVEAWNTRRSDVLDHAIKITESLGQLAIGTGPAADEVPKAKCVEVAIEGLLKTVDQTWGGFGGAPKFPHATDLLLFLQVAERTGDRRLLEATELTLDRMAAGGIRDHIGGGFARYSVDDRWLVPHFEKMLYDNALLAETYTRAFQVTGHSRHAEVATEILDYVCRDLIDPSGGIHCSEDADSEGVEGKFYVWDPPEVIEVLGPERGERFCKIYDITTRGNFEGHSIANLPRGLPEWADDLQIEVDTLVTELAEDREQLRVARTARVKPGRDDKIVVAWNALAIRALTIGAEVLSRPDFRDVAQRAADFVCQQMLEPNGRLLHVYRDGRSDVMAMVDDYALLGDALLHLDRLNAQPGLRSVAKQLAEELLSRFADSEHGGFFYTADDAPELIARHKDWHDGSMISGNAAAARFFWQLSRVEEQPSHREVVSRVLRCADTVIREQSRACSALIAVLDEYHHS